MINKSDIELLNIELANKSAVDIINWVKESFPADKIAFSSSLSAEDQVVTNLLPPDIRIFFLDTGRHFEETYTLLAESESFFKRKIEVYFPSPDDVEAFVKSNGVNSFYDSPQLRKQCCHLRKILPLTRALSGAECWITGLRKEQSVTRFDTSIVEWDEKFNIIKVNPIISWSEAEVWEYIKNRMLPYNSLHDKGYPSIGCAPCTRSVKKIEETRSGRWWWEPEEKKECGLHLKDGKLVRIGG